MSYNISTGYIGFRGRMQTDRGERVVYLEGTNFVTSRNSYTVTRPLYGEYVLINVSTGRPLMIISED